MSAETEAEAEVQRRTEHLPAWKEEEVAALSELIGRYESVGVVDITGIPSRQLQDMRADLHGTAEIRMGRNTLIERALEAVDEGMEDLVAYVDGHVGLIGTDQNPFGLFRQLEESKVSAPINAGEVAPDDIVIEEGDTGMDPGPFVGELQTVGAAAQIMEGSIRVTETSVVAEAGDVVSDDLANVLTELGVEPKEVGLDLRAVVSDGVLFEADELAIDLDEYRADVEQAGARARTLSINAAYPTTRTVADLIATATSEATSVGLVAAVEDPSLISDLVGRADARVRALAARIDDDEALPEELRGVEAPAPAPTEDADTDDDEPDDETDDAAAEADAAPDDEGPDEDDDEDVSGEGLGDLFG